jgi:hypothetical protein
VKIAVGSEFEIRDGLAWIPCRLLAEVREGVFEFEMDGIPSGILVAPVIDAMIRNRDLRIRRTKEFRTNKGRIAT